MSRLTLCIALLAAALVAVGCGGSNDKSSSTDQSKPSVAVTSAGATEQASVDTKAKAKAAAKAAAVKAEVAKKASRQVRQTLRSQKTAIKQAHTQSKSILKDLNKKGTVSSQEKALIKKAIKGKITKQQAKQLQKLQTARAKAVQQAIKLPKKSKATVPGKPGLSKIPGRVIAACDSHLRAVDGVLNSSSKASKLPKVLSTTIGELEVLGSTSSPAATGVTGDYSGMSRTQETMAAMQRVLAPAKSYAKSPTAANKQKLAQALKGLDNTARVDELNTCAIA